MTPPRRRRRLLAGGAVLALLVAGGATAAALATGGDGSPYRTPTAGPSPSMPTSPDPTGDPTGDSTGDPTGSGDAAPEPVLGDLDGDGLGDLVLSDFDRSYVLSSTGKDFGEPTTREVAGKDVILGDFNGDGRNELLRIEGDASRLALTAVIADAPRRTSSLRIPEVPYDNAYDIDYLAADVDGDGVDDFVAATPDGKGLELTVSLNRGDGTFEKARSWLETKLPYERTDWAVADFDGDGRDDLVHCDPDEFGDFETPGTATLLRSTGTAFTKLGAALELPKTYDESIITLDSFGAADVDGDGVDELVGYSPYGMDAVIWRWAATEFRGQRVWANGEPVAGGGGIYGSLSDVDGDGRADIVTVGIDGVRVHLSTGSSFDYAPAWRRPGRLADDADVVGAVKLGIS